MRLTLFHCIFSPGRPGDYHRIFGYRQEEVNIHETSLSFLAMFVEGLKMLEAKPGFIINCVDVLWLKPENVYTINSLKVVPKIVCNNTSWCTKTQKKKLLSLMANFHGRANGGVRKIFYQLVCSHRLIHLISYLKVLQLPVRIADNWLSVSNGLVHLSK